MQTFSGSFGARCVNDAFSSFLRFRTDGVPYFYVIEMACTFPIVCIKVALWQNFNWLIVYKVALFCGRLFYPDYYNFLKVCLSFISFFLSSFPEVVDRRFVFVSLHQPVNTSYGSFIRNDRTANPH